ncbi:hypothetical protein [Actinokineospora sp.]|uniref:hypothetical protein n=1 Tax=Actinokineospora sp. TaxID=1872133 RepID=UPI003D6C528C
MAAGLMPPSLGVAPIPMHRVIADELVLLGSHGVQAHEYPAMLGMVERSGIDLSRRVGSASASTACRTRWSR